MTDVKTKLWTVTCGSWPIFEVEETDGSAWSFLHTPNDAALNGTHPTELAALESLIRSLEDTKHQLAAEIARHKRRRLALTRKSDTRRMAETGTGSGRRPGSAVGFSRFAQSQSGRKH